MTPPAPPSVTQADREAAADFITALTGDIVGRAGAFRKGECDDYTEVQAFARHRTTAEAASAARVADAIVRDLALTQLANTEDASTDWLEGFEFARVRVKDLLAKHQQGEG